MRLLGKIAGSVLLGIIALLMVDGYLSVRREVDLFDRDMARDAMLMGKSLRPVVEEAWQEGGDAAARRVVEDVNRNETDLSIRWVRLDDGVDTTVRPRVSPAVLDTLGSDSEVSVKLTSGPGAGYRYTYVWVAVGEGTAALELAEPLSHLYAYTRATVIRRLLLAAALVAVSLLILWALGVRFVGRPLEQLVQKTRRVGRGDFTGDVVVPGRDELAHLASAMNEMCGQLDSARRELRAETEARMETLEQLRHSERLAMLGRLSSGIAHELGTPLNVVAGRASLIATEDLGHDDVVAFARTIEDQAHRMTNIIRQLLGFARRRPPRREPCDLMQLVREVTDLLASSARKEDVTMEVLAADPIPEVSVDRSHIQQVLMNLMMNGIHAMPDGGLLTVELATASSRHRGVSEGPLRDYVTIRVRDEGTGIDEKDLSVIFDPFFTTKESGKGTGLGLSIAYGIAEEHDGWIDVESKPGSGACFTVFLPIEVPA